MSGTELAIVLAEPFGHGVRLVTCYIKNFFRELCSPILLARFYTLRFKEASASISDDMLRLRERALEYRQGHPLLGNPTDLLNPIGAGS
jgi:hypothetical protein